MSDAKKGEKNPMFGQNISEETITKISPSPHLGGVGGVWDALKGQPRAEGALRRKALSTNRSY